MSEKWDWQNILNEAKTEVDLCGKPTREEILEQQALDYKNSEEVNAFRALAEKTLQNHSVLDKLDAIAEDVWHTGDIETLNEYGLRKVEGGRFYTSPPGRWSTSNGNVSGNTQEFDVWECKMMHGYSLVAENLVNGERSRLSIYLQVVKHEPAHDIYKPYYHQWLSGQISQLPVDRYVKLMLESVPVFMGGKEIRSGYSTKEGNKYWNPWINKTIVANKTEMVLGGPGVEKAIDLALAADCEARASMGLL